LFSLLLGGRLEKVALGKHIFLRAPLIDIQDDIVGTYLSGDNPLLTVMLGGLRHDAAAVGDAVKRSLL
jgi:hypothetical protein